MCVVCMVLSQVDKLLFDFINIQSARHFAENINFLIELGFLSILSFNIDDNQEAACEFWSQLSAIELDF